MRKTYAVVLAAVLAASACSGPTTSGEDEPAADFYKGKTIDIIVSWAPGGTGDIAARILAKYLGDSIPGNPRIAVQNMSGGGHNIGTNYLYNTAEPDGLTLGVFASHRIPASITSDEGVEFDAQKFEYLANLTYLPAVCAAWHTAGFNSFDDLKNSGKTWQLGDTSAGAVGGVVGRMMWEDLGIPIQNITGYEGVTDVLLAMEQGEVQGACQTWPTLTAGHPEYISEKKLIPLFVAGSGRDPQFPDVPNFTEFDWSPEYRAAVDAYGLRLTVTVPVAAPPGTPQDRLDILDQAIAEVSNNSDYRAEMESVGLPVANPFNATQMTEIVDKMYAAPVAAWELIAQLQGS